MGHGLWVMGRACGACGVEREERVRFVSQEPKPAPLTPHPSPLTPHASPLTLGTKLSEAGYAAALKREFPLA